MQLHGCFRSIAVLSLLASLVTSPAHAELPLQADECEYIESELIELDVDELLEFALEPECDALRSAALELAENRWRADEQTLRASQNRGHDDAIENELADLQEKQKLLSLLRVREALDTGDSAQARARLHALLSELRPLQSEDEDGEADEELLGLKSELEAIQAILSAPAATPGFVLKIAAPRAEWQLSFGWCGTPAMMFEYLHPRLPTRAAAWRALGQPRAAFDALLEADWVEALELGRLPQKIRDYADAAFGPGAFEAEFDRGLQQIWIEPGVDGRYAYLPLFGRLLPLPLGIERTAVRSSDSSDNGRQTQTFERADEIAAYLRGIAASAR